MPLESNHRYGPVARVYNIPSLNGGESPLFDNLSSAFTHERIVIQQTPLSLRSRLTTPAPKDKDWPKLCRRLVDYNFSVTFPSLLVRPVFHGEDYDDVANSQELGVALAGWKVEEGMVEFNCSCPELILFLRDLAQWGCGIRRNHKGCEFFFYDCTW
jgi:hypothetical protein